MSNQILFGRKIRALRKAARLSRERLAELVGRNSNYLGEIERGEKWPSLRVISDLAGVLRVPVSSLFEFESQELNPSQLKLRIRQATENRSVSELQRACRILKALFDS